MSMPPTTHARVEVDSQVELADSATETWARLGRSRPTPIDDRRGEVEPQRRLGVNPLMGPPDSVSHVSIMGPNRALHSNLLGGPDTIPSVSVMGTHVVGSSFDLLGGSDPGSVDHLFTRSGAASKDEEHGLGDRARPTAR
jgi:hypothetical protein